MTDTVDTIAQNLPISETQKQQISEKAEQVSNQVSATIVDQVGSRAMQAGEQATTIAGALRTSGQQLQEQGQSAPANLVNMAADRADQLGEYLSYADPNQILSDVEDFCRQQPWVVIAGGLALGFVGARFLKSSSTRRYSGYETSRYGDGYSSTGNGYTGGNGYRTGRGYGYTEGYQRDVLSESYDVGGV